MGVAVAGYMVGNHDAERGNWSPVEAFLVMASYLATATFTDHCVGRLIEALRASAHADNTIVVVWSDHGFHLGEKMHWEKRSLWEESTQVPLIFYVRERTTRLVVSARAAWG